MLIINCTPHVVNVDGVEFVPSGIVPRVATTEEVVDTQMGVSLVRTTFGEVTDFPTPVEGVLFIVSGLVRAACPERKDLVSPSGLVRDEEGKVTGCKALTF